ncbi:unnamed protein product [Bathycoccus prasinos]
MGFNNKKRKSNPSDGNNNNNNNKRIQKRDFKKSNRSNSWDKEPKGKRPARGGGKKNNGEGKYGATEYVRENEHFEAYYSAQKICSSDEDFANLMRVLKTDLPSSFRINGVGNFAARIKQRVKNEFATLSGAGLEDIKPPKAVEWYPDSGAWQFSYSRLQLRSVPQLKSLHEFLKSGQEFGSITRQEVVSMIPTQFLKVEPHHKVLDMCAAPGSKTFQVLEALHRDFESYDPSFGSFHADAEGGKAELSAKMPTGFVVANDADLKRCNLLTHQTKRANSPCLLVTNHEGQNFPVIKGEPGNAQDDFKFDSILCDVPCSGDGTMRKAPDIWARWHGGFGNGLHSLQIKIAKRAAQILKVGGRMVYSTCSLNPIENEAVVMSLMKATNGALTLVDVSKGLPNLKRSNGLRDWQVWGKSNRRWNSAEEAHENNEKVVASSMFPDKEFLDTIPIENCVRILPHHSDTGGFFVAVFDKVRELDPEIETQIENEANGNESKKSKTKEFSKFKGLGMAEVKCHFEYPSSSSNGDSGDQIKLSLTVEQPKPPKEKYSRDPQDGTLLFLNAHGQDQSRPGRKGFDGVAPVNSPDVVDPINEKYGIHSLQIEKNCVTRTAAGSKPKRVYYVTPNLRQYIAADTRESLRITAIGLKVFERQNLNDDKDSYFGADSKVLSSCNYRLNQDGLFLTLPFMTKQAITITIPELLQILKLRGLALVENEPVPDGSKFTPRPSFTDAETRKHVESCSQGSLVCLLRDEDVQKLNCSRSEFAITCWKGKTSLNLLVSKVETEHLLEKLKAHTRDVNDNA